jgi:hypothetical protein
MIHSWTLGTSCGSVLIMSRRELSVVTQLQRTETNWRLNFWKHFEETHHVIHNEYQDSVRNQVLNRDYYYV